MIVLKRNRYDFNAHEGTQEKGSCEDERCGVKCWCAGMVGEGTRKSCHTDELTQGTELR